MKYLLGILLMTVITHAKSNPTKSLQNQEDETAKLIGEIFNEMKGIGLNSLLKLKNEAFEVTDSDIKSFSHRILNAYKTAWNSDIVKDAFGQVDWNPLLKSTLVWMQSFKKPISQINWIAFKNAYVRIYDARCYNNPYFTNYAENGKMLLCTDTTYFIVICTAFIISDVLTLGGRYQY